MKNLPLTLFFSIFIFLIFTFGCGSKSEQSSMSMEEAIKIQDHYRVTMTALATANTEKQRLFALPDAAKVSLLVGKDQDAELYAREMLQTMDRFKGEIYYGQVVHDANIVLGRLALKSGDLEGAREHLLSAGKSPGAPELEKLGPNMCLASELLEKGEKDAVLLYLNDCKQFWQSHRGRLDLWIQQIESDQNPDFGKNMDL